MSLPESSKGVTLCVAIIVGIFVAGVMAYGAEKTKENRDSKKEEKPVYDPFSLPGGVGFKKEEGAEVEGFSLSKEWEEGMYPSHVNGIFLSGRGSAAIINRVLVKEGSWVGDEQIIEIKKDAVVLARKDGTQRILPFNRGKLDVKVSKRIRLRAKKGK